jgi:hypothetical protein
MAAKVSGFFRRARAADRDEADRFFMAMCHRGRPRGLPYPADDLEARLADGARGPFDAVVV